MATRIVVTGATGFIGSEVCRYAAGREYEVVGLSRRGRPAARAPWTAQVRWIRADVLRPDGWRAFLPGSVAVIHAVGIARERPQDGITFERFHRDAVAIAAWEAKHAGVEHFVYLSSDATPPFRSPRFLTAKRDGETVLQGLNLRASILRPAYVYGPEDRASMVVGRLLTAAGKMPGLRHTMRSVHPLRVEQVAVAAVRAATEPGLEGIIGIDHMAHLAEGRWGAPEDAVPFWHLHGPSSGPFAPPSA